MARITKGRGRDCNSGVSLQRDVVASSTLTVTSGSDTGIIDNANDAVVDVDVGVDVEVDVSIDVDVEMGDGEVTVVAVGGGGDKAGGVVGKAAAVKSVGGKKGVGRKKSDGGKGGAGGIPEALPPLLRAVASTAIAGEGLSTGVKNILKLAMGEQA